MNDFSFENVSTWPPYCHVRDFARVFVASLEKLKLPSVMNIGSDSENHRKLDIVQLICSKLDGVTPQIRNLGDGRDRRNYRVGFGLMTSSLGLTPTYSVEHTIEQVAMGLNYSLFDMPGVRYGNT